MARIQAVDERLEGGEHPCISEGTVPGALDEHLAQ